MALGNIGDLIIGYAFGWWGYHVWLHNYSVAARVERRRKAQK